MFTVDYISLSGPLEGEECDDGGQWMSYHFRWNVAAGDYEIFDRDLQLSFDRSGYSSVKEWINSWDTLEVGL